MKKISSWIVENSPWLILVGVALICFLFMFFGTKSDNGSITLDGQDAKIEEYTEKFIEDSNSALYRIMNEDAPTDEATIEEYEDGVGLGGSTTLEAVKSRRLPDGDTDGGKGWQCSKYTAYLGTGRREYSSAHPDYGPVNGKDVASWLVKNYGWEYTDEPVEGAIGSGGFNTLYGHTAEFLYWTGNNTAMVSDANYVPLTVSTHNLNVAGWVWVVPGDYEPEPTPEPTPTPTPPSKSVTYTYVPGDYFSKVLIKLNLDEGNLWGEGGTVKYYTNQLIEQDMLDSRGNVKLYVPFTLTHR